MYCFHVQRVHITEIMEDKWELSVNLCHNTNKTFSDFDLLDAWICQSTSECDIPSAFCPWEYFFFFYRLNLIKAILSYCTSK